MIANERKDRLAQVAATVIALGHEVIAREINVEDIGSVTAWERPDVALVGLGESSEHALGLIDMIVHEAACPVIVLLYAPDPTFLKEAAKRGVFAHISDDDVEDWPGSIEIVLRRFAEYHDLQGAFARRAVIERAKGILMERHSIDADAAFEKLRERSRIDNRKLIDLAAASRAPCTASPGRSSAFDGMHAQYVHRPPTKSRSTTATRRPPSARAAAQCSPGAPPPRTITS